MYRWFLILLILLLPAAAFGQLNESGGGAGGADADSIVGIPVEDTTGNLADNDVMRYDLATNSWKHEAPPGAGGGETNTVSNLGIDADSIFYQKVGVDFQFRRLIGEGTVTVAAKGDTALSITGSAHTVLNDSLLGTGEAAAIYETITNVGKITDDTTNYQTAYTHSQNATQEHSDYARNVGDTTTGTYDFSQGNITDVNAIFADTVIIGADTLVSEDIPAHELRMIAHNASGVTIPNGTPVYISGATGDIPNIDSARADNAATMPARGIVQGDIANGGDGHIVVAGGIQKLNTSAYSVHDELYIAATGGFTTTKPTGTNLIQKIGEITRVNPSNGEIEVGGAGRTNDIPNIASAYFWLGNGSGVGTAVTMSNDATMDNAGVVTIGTDVINDTHINWGTGANQVSIIDVPAENWKVIYSNGTGVITELALGSAGEVLKSNGATSAPTWQTDATGGSPALVDIFAYQSRAYFDTTTADPTDSMFVILADSAGKALQDAAGNTITSTYQVTITDGNALTFTGATLDFDGGASPSGDLGGTWGTPSVNDDSHNHIYSNIDATTSANWAEQISDETGTGVFVFSIAPTLTNKVTVDSLTADSVSANILNADDSLIVAGDVILGLDDGDLQIDAGVLNVTDNSHNHIITDISAFTETELETQLSDATAVFTNNVTGDVTVSGGTSTIGSNVVDSTNVADGDLALDDLNWHYEYIYLEMVHGWGRAVEDSSYLTLPIHDGSSSYLFLDYAGNITPTHNDTVFVSGAVPFGCSVDSVGWMFKEVGSGQMSVINLYGPDRSDAVNMTDSSYYTSGTDREPASWTAYTEDITDIAALTGDRFAVRFVFEFDADDDSMFVGWVRLAVRR